MLVYLQMIETEEDRSKFEEIYREYRDLLFFLAVRRLKNAEDAEDTVHQVFVRIAERIGNIEPAGPRTKRLVMVMTENAATDLLRKRTRRSGAEYREEELAAPAPEDGEADLLDRCLWKLPEQQRTVVWLKYRDGYSLREIAGLLGITLVWAQKLDQRAKKRLAELYLEGGGSL